jgi:S-adenosylmethionine hydrolase
VLATWCPNAHVIDITHGIRRHDIRAGAVALRGAVGYMPPGVHMAIVDPDVGRPSRRAVALRTAARNHLLVGPDNGLLALAAARLGGVIDAIDIGDSAYRLDPVCATFHGRDIFSPVAAALASGAKLEETGQPFDPAKLKKIDVQRPRIDGDQMIAQVLTIDQFGNIELNVDHNQIAEFGLRVGMAVELNVEGETFAANYCYAFADARRDALLVYEDAQQQLAIAVNHGSAAERLGIERDAELRLQIG